MSLARCCRSLFLLVFLVIQTFHVTVEKGKLSYNSLKKTIHEQIRDHQREGRMLEVFKVSASFIWLKNVSWVVKVLNVITGHTCNKVNNKQLLDEVFVTSRIIKVEVGVISPSRRLRLITLTETVIILLITKTESNNCFIIH